MKEQHGSGSE
jgi:hypothetical protein